MPGVERAGDLASCGSHGNTGSDAVLVNGRGITRASIDSVAGGIITGGSPTVLAEGFPVSIAGDACVHPSESPHTDAVTANPSSDVIIGSFALPEMPPELTAVLLTVQAPAEGVAPAGVEWAGPTIFDFTILNSSLTITPPFTVGIFEIEPDEFGQLTLPENLVTLRRGSTGFPGISLVWEMSNIIVQPGNIFRAADIGFANASITVPADSRRYYILALDIDIDIPTELIFENNMSLPVSITTGG